MTLNDLIVKAYNTGMQLSSGDVLLLLNGESVSDVVFSVARGNDGVVMYVNTTFKK